MRNFPMLQKAKRPREIPARPFWLRVELTDYSEKSYSALSCTYRGFWKLVGIR